MSHEAFVYAINCTIAVILAAILSAYWRRSGRGSGLGVWAAGAWTMAVADLLFATRPWLPMWAGRLVPTVLVTVGLGVLLLGAQVSIGRRETRSAVAGVTLAHALVLAAFVAIDSESAWRTAFNGLVWSVLSFAAFITLRRVAAPVRRVFEIPAAVFFAHASFHAVRASIAVMQAVTPAASVAGGLQVAGDAEAILFMVALFVSMLAAHLTLRNEELRSARIEVDELSGLLPLCAWCRKVRDGEGYWQQVERYFAARSGVTFTHSICDSCLEHHFPDEAPIVTASRGTRRV